VYTSPPCRYRQPTGPLILTLSLTLTHRPNLPKFKQLFSGADYRFPRFNADQPVTLWAILFTSKHHTDKTAMTTDKPTKIDRATLQRSSLLASFRRDRWWIESLHNRVNSERTIRNSDAVNDGRWASIQQQVIGTITRDVITVCPQ